GNYVSTAEVRLTTQTGPSPPTPWCGWGLNASTAECHGRRRIQVPGIWSSSLWRGTIPAADGHTTRGSFPPRRWPSS
ncbi:MAG: hypothetical protein ACOX9B_06740, partial [Candidatus Xenobium sp.]